MILKKPRFLPRSSYLYRTSNKDTHVRVGPPKKKKKKRKALIPPLNLFPRPYPSIHLSPDK